MANPTQIATVAVPLLFVVATELSQASRDMDLKSIAKEGKKPFFFIFASDALFPQLGRFNFIHGMNSVLFGVGVSIETYLLMNQPFVQGMLILITLLGWIILPAIEVTEYDQILNEVPDSVYSVHAHVVGTVVFTVYLYWMIGSLFNSQKELQLGLIDSGLTFAVTGLPIASIIYILYMTRLQSELEAIDSTEEDTTSRRIHAS